MKLDDLIDQWGWRDHLIATGVPAADLAMFGPMQLMDGLFELVGKRRADQRSAQAVIENELGQPITAMRYFSYEEQADDTSVGDAVDDDA